MTRLGRMMRAKMPAMPGLPAVNGKPCVLVGWTGPFASHTHDRVDWQQSNSKQRCHAVGIFGNVPHINVNATAGKAGDYLNALLSHPIPSIGLAGVASPTGRWYGRITMACTWLYVSRRWREGW